MRERRREALGAAAVDRNDDDDEIDVGELLRERHRQSNAERVRATKRKLVASLTAAPQAEQEAYAAALASTVRCNINCRTSV